MHREPGIHIKMMVMPQQGTYWGLELEYVTDGKKRLVGYKTLQDGKQQPVYGSAHWDGDRLVYEQEHPSAKNSASRIIRSLRITNNGDEMIGDQDYWIVGSEKKREEVWHWEKKHDLP